MPPRPRGPTGRPGEWADGARGRRRGWWALAIAVVAAAVVVAALAATGRGPWTGSLPEARFDPATHAETPRPLLLSDIAARSAAEGTGGGSPRRMVDGDADTAWRSDGDQLPGGAGERIDLHLESPAWIDHLVLHNGDHSDGDAYASHGRLRRVELHFDGGGRARVRFEDLGREAQVLPLPEPRLTTSVRIEVDEVFEGDAWQDVAVSGLRLMGWRARGDDAEVARQRASRAPAAG